MLRLFLLLHASLCHLDAVQITDAHGVQGSTHSLCCTGRHSFSCSCGVGVSWSCPPAVGPWSRPRHQRRGEPSALESSGLACNLCPPRGLCMSSACIPAKSVYGPRMVCTCLPCHLLPRSLAAVAHWQPGLCYINKKYSASQKALAPGGSVSLRI